MSDDAIVMDAALAQERRRRWHHWLALLPAVGMLGGVPFVNRVHPLVLGLPLLFAWLAGWVLATSAVMACILMLDRAQDRRSDAMPGTPEVR
jgi:hypothetical protein